MQPPRHSEWCADMRLSSFRFVETLDIVRSLNCLRFAAICRNQFEYGVKDHGNRYSSISLMRSICSLATALAGNRIDGIRIQIPGSTSNSELGASLAREVIETLNNRRTPLNLADTQALGVLSIYHISRGQKTNGLALAKSFALAATNLCLSETCLKPSDDTYMRIRASTFCGAITLNRYVLSTEN